MLEVPYKMLKLVGILYIAVRIFLILIIAKLHFYMSVSQEQNFVHFHRKRQHYSVGSKFVKVHEKLLRTFEFYYNTELINPFAT